MHWWILVRQAARKSRTQCPGSPDLLVTKAIYFIIWILFRMRIPTWAHCFSWRIFWYWRSIWSSIRCIFFINQLKYTLKCLKTRAGLTLSSSSRSIICCLVAKAPNKWWFSMTTPFSLLTVENLAAKFHKFLVINVFHSKDLPDEYFLSFLFLFLIIKTGSFFFGTSLCKTYFLFS